MTTHTHTRNTTANHVIVNPPPHPAIAAADLKEPQNTSRLRYPGHPHRLRLGDVISGTQESEYFEPRVSQKHLLVLMYVNDSRQASHADIKL